MEGAGWAGVHGCTAGWGHVEVLGVLGGLECFWGAGWVGYMCILRSRCRSSTCGRYEAVKNTLHWTILRIDALQCTILLPGCHDDKIQRLRLSVPAP